MSAPDWEALWAEREAKRAKDRRRQERPADLGLKPLHESVRGECRWCGGAIYRVNKDGHVVVDRRRMWHEGREVHPDAQPETECVQEYNAQKFTFRGAVGAKDGYVCQSCGIDLKAELAAWEREWEAWQEHNESIHERESEAEDARRRAMGWPAWIEWRNENYATYRTAWDRKYDRSREWQRRFGRCPAWHADHVIPLEDGGLHEVANGQVLCPPCHARKTAQENAERAARRRGDSQSNQMEMAS